MRPKKIDPGSDDVGHIEHKTLNDQAYERIKKGLVSSEFKPGEVLVIRQLADTYGISVTPVREALQRLVAEQSLHLLPNRSIAVPVLTVDSFEELRQIRCALEGLAGELAAPRLTATHAQRLQGIVDAIDENIERREVRAYLANNQKFHFFIYERSGLPVLLQMIQNLWVQVGPYFYGLFEDSHYLAHANEGHKRIMAAIREGRPAAVRQSVMDDINEAGASLIPRLRELTN